MKKILISEWTQRITTGWGFIRLLRLALAIFVIVEAFKNYDLLFGALGIILLAQALFNVGCCASAGCEVNSRVKAGTPATSESEITFKEIK
jgi:hypothetical protein